jgi:proteasome accessory factor B
MARRDQFERLMRLLSLVARPEGATLPDLRTELCVARRTVYRDLETLERCGVPIFVVDDELPKRWHVRPEFRRQASLTLGPDELILLAVLEGVSEGNGPFAEPLTRLLGKIRAALPTELLRRARALTTCVAALARPSGREGTPVGLLTVLAEAIETHAQVQLDYEGRSTGRSVRAVEPLALALRGRGVYLVARDPLRADVRKYLLTRVRAARLMGTRFRPPADFDVDEYFGDAFGVHGGEVHDVVLHFDREAARHVRESVWHRSQRIEDRPDGSVVFSMRAAGMVEIKSWVQSYGAAVRVLGPPALAEAVRQDALLVTARATVRESPALPSARPSRRPGAGTGTGNRAGGAR